MYYYWSEAKKKSAASLINQIPGLIAGWSVRNISNAIISNPIKSCRSSDNAENDIAFYQNNNISLSSTASGGGTYGSFVGANSATIAKWYDQSGNSRDILTATLSQRPTNVTSGSLVTKNSLPTVFFSTDDELTVTNAAFGLDMNMSILFVGYISNFTNHNYIIDNREPVGGKGYALYTNATTGNIILYLSDGTNSQTFTWAAPALNTLLSFVLRVFRNGMSVLQVNNNTQVSATYSGSLVLSPANTGIFKLGGSSPNNFNGGISEIIISNQYIPFAVRDSYIANAMTYYGIT